MKKRISLMGEVLVDLIENNKLNFSPVPGGAIFNTTNTLSKLGVLTSFYSQIGDDYWGRYILQEMIKNGIDHNFIKVDKLFKTPLAFATLDKSGNAVYDFYKSKFDYHIQTNDLYNTGIFFYGSFFSVMDENQKNIEKIIATSKREKSIICYDPNYRKNYTKKNLKNLFKNITNSHIVKLSTDDAKNIFDMDNISEIFKTLNNFGTILTIITDGKNGAYLSFLNKPYIKVDSKEVKVVDTIGAGDNFSAGILYYLYEKEIFCVDFLRSLKDEQLYTLLTTGIDVASISLTVKGADIPKEMLSDISIV